LPLWLRCKQQVRLPQAGARHKLASILVCPEVCRSDITQLHSASEASQLQQAPGLAHHFLLDIGSMQRSLPVMHDASPIMLTSYIATIAC
jgi:hypothetical protein